MVLFFSFYWPSFFFDDRAIRSETLPGVFIQQFCWYPDPILSQLPLRWFAGCLADSQRDLY